jgi:hypothetical protein
MSYRQQFRDQVPYSGRTSVSYPKSESGGSMVVEYDGTVTVDILVDVNTDPFDRSVSSVNGTVDVLTGAVVAMHSAQCAAIAQTAENVSQSLIDGFFGTIKTEISQQLQALDSAIKATFGLISEQGKAVSRQKEVMEGDYNRISSRYVTLFSDLDAECHKRILALDKPAFVLSGDVQKKLILDTISRESAGNFIAVQEESTSRGMLLVSGLYRKVRDVMHTLHQYITQETRLTSLIDSSLGNEKISGAIVLQIPVIFTESDMLEGSGTAGSCFVSDFIDPDKKAAVFERAGSYCGDSGLSWTEPEGAGQEQLNKEFLALGEEEFGGEDDAKDGGALSEKRRIYDMLINLWQESKVLTLKRS